MADFADALEVGLSNPASPTAGAIRVYGRVAEGLYANPLARFAIRQTLGNIARVAGGSPEWVDEKFSQLSGALGPPGTAGKILNLVGEYGPDFWAGTKLLGWSQRLLESAVASRATMLARGTMGPVEDSVGAVTKQWLSSQGDQAARFIGRTAGSAPVVKPTLLTAAEIGTRSATMGAFMGARKYAEPDADVGAALRDAALGAAWAGVIDTALVAGGKLLLSGARSIDPTKAIQHAEDTLGFRPEVSGTPGTLTDLGGPAGKMLTGLQRTASRLSAAEALNLQLRRQVEQINATRSPTGGLLPPPDSMTISIPRKDRAFQLATGTLRGSGQVTYGQLKEVAPKLTRKVAAAQASAQSLSDMLFYSGSPLNSYVSETPIYRAEGGFMGLLRNFVEGSVEPPEDWVGKLGVISTQTFNRLKDAFTDITLTKSHIANTVADWRSRLATVESALTGSAPKGEEWVRKYVGEYQVRGLPGVQRRFGNDAAKVFGEIRQSLDDAYAPLVRQGAEPPMSYQTLTEMGTPGGYLPHVHQPLDPKQFVVNMGKSLVATGQAATQAEGELLAERFATMGRRGPTRYGSFEHQRFVKGDLETLLKYGAPYAEPLAGIEDYLMQATYRQTMGQLVGFKGELVPKLVALSRAEGGRDDLLKTVLDSVVGRKYYDSAMQRFAHTVTSLETALKMPFAVMANSVQWSFNGIGYGLPNALRGFAQAVGQITTREGRLQSSLMTGTLDSMYQEIRRSLAPAYNLEPLSKGVSKAADVVLTWTGFNPVEQYVNRASGFLSARLSILDDIGMAAAGKLRGNNLAAAERRLARVGLDLTEWAGKVKAAPSGAPLTNVIPGEVLDRAAFRGMQQFQFAQDAMGRPLSWSSPRGQLLSQFKGFMLNYARMMRDQVWAEWAHGNTKPLTNFLVIAPLAGEVVNGIGDAVKGKRPDRYHNDLQRFIDDVSAVGGLGVVSSVLTSAKYGRLTDFLAGPAITDAVQLSQAVLQGRPDLMLTWATKQPLVMAVKRIADVGNATVGHLMELADWDTSSEGSPVGGGLAPSMGDHLAKSKVAP